MSHQSRRTFVKRVGVTAGSGLFLGGGAAATNAAESKAGQVPFERSIPLARTYDVVVCGGGPSGCAAALAAKREGLTVLLIEGQGQLGGMATSGMVSHWLGGRNQQGSGWWADYFAPSPRRPRREGMPCFQSSIPGGNTILSAG